MHGDKYFGDDKAIITGIAFLEDIPVTVIGEQKGKNTKDNLYRNFGMPNPEGYRKALRAMKQAEKFGRPVITFIDTPGAYPGMGAEERGQGLAIAKNLMEMAELTVPIIAIVTGEGSSGGALALGVGNKVLMLENAIYSILSPEGFATILWKDASKANEAADVMKLTAQDLKRLKVIDGIIKEPKGGITKDSSEGYELIKQAILKELELMKNCTQEQIVSTRYEKFRKIGEFTKINE